MMIEDGGTNTMGVAEDLVIIAEQEKLLRFPAFNADTAWKLGSALRSLIDQRGTGGTVEIEIAGQVLFSAATVGATPGQADWIRRKRNVVHRFARSTYFVGLTLQQNGETMEARHGLELKDYAAHCGGFPIHVEGTGIIGSVIASGLPQRDDHSLVVAAMTQVLGITAPQLT
jgi:uncharacterized protein (UPF0303 family)